MLEGEYETELKECLKSILSEDNTFIDLGANEGYFSIIASNLVGKKGRVLAIEPQSRLQNIIKENIKLNKLSNIELVQALVTNEVGEENISLSPDMNTGSSGVLRKQKYIVSREKVKSTTLIKLINDFNIDTVDLIKIDIEGSEYEAILGSKKLFKSHLIQNIALELHPKFLKMRNLEEREILDFLYECGYQRNKNYKNLVLSL